MSEDRQKILQMLADEKITVEEADKLLSALNRPESEPAKSPKYMRIVVTGSSEGKSKDVNIRVPISIIKAGMKLGSFMPEKASETLKEKGIQVDDEFIRNLGELNIDVGDGEEKVRIFCE